MISRSVPTWAPTIGALVALAAPATLPACGPAHSSSPPPASGTPVTTTPSASPFDLARPFLGLGGM